MPSSLHLWVLFLLLIAGCASALPPEPAPAARSPAVEAAIVATPSETLAGPKRPVPEGHLRREDVMEVLSAGVPALLQRIEVEPSLDREGRFQGWRVVAIRDPLLASGDLYQGDVVRRINGQPIENPYQFFDVFQSMAFAPELLLEIDRGNEPRALRYPISDDPSAPPIPRAVVQAPPPEATPPGTGTGPPAAASPPPNHGKKKSKKKP
ncbi:MAG: hypothetical protein RMJ98_11020 [Myxococcales bacterium]|nr:hypothetical protein [Polyangiaceae bacterium]MDW8249818.1 hypothetical protein [Myxococcales bacterium]